MVSLITQQRDLLRYLLTAKTPVVISDVAEQIHLTPRQVSYRPEPIKRWLASRDTLLKTTPGVGVEIECSSTQISQSPISEKAKLFLDES